MAHFSYGKLTEKEHQKRFDVWLDIDNNSELIKTILKNKNKRWTESINRIIVKDYIINNNLIRLEIWCKNYFELFVFKKHRYNVFYITLQPDEEWCCHDDLGKGYI